MQVPIGGGYYTNAKWIQQRDDGCVNLLVGKDFDEQPYSTDLFLNPSYSDEVAAPLPCWFSNILTSPTPTYHTLCKAVSDLDDWNAIAEVERYHHYNDHHRCLANELSQLQCKLSLIDDAIATAHHRMEVAQIPALVPNLKFLTSRDALTRSHTQDVGLLTSVATATTLTMDQEIQSRREGDVIASYRRFNVQAVNGRKHKRPTS